MTALSRSRRDGMHCGPRCSSSGARRRRSHRVHGRGARPWPQGVASPHTGDGRRSRHARRDRRLRLAMARLAQRAVRAMPEVPPPNEVAPWRRMCPSRFRWTVRGILLADIRECGSRTGARDVGTHARPVRRERRWASWRHGPEWWSCRRRGGPEPGPLDNACGSGRSPTPSGILIEFDPYFINGGYCTGRAHLVRRTGTLLGIASQRRR